ncbi:hypothetical protein RF182_17600 [Escherichia coli]|uniref:hypothetical protein n=1 Tax=Escherichia coli TaxID=562 RepID=UPI0006A57390|nr:hypothetical protein [Escherichia coli]EBR3449818.1 hypothetical protein [Salmonella enterica]MDQ9261854.1 hypothetical protein [Escherichia coli]HBD4852572.1 hypothetical protein [Escherichia coli]
MFYLVETKYIGPQPHDDRNVDSHKIEICTKPAGYDEQKKPILEGWCGSFNDHSVYMHGQYETLDEAREAMSRIFGEVREADADESVLEPDEDILECYKVGKYIPMSSDATGSWAYDVINSEITADTTDERISQLVVECEAEANSLGYKLSKDLEDFMEQRRQELRDQAEQEE